MLVYGLSVSGAWFHTPDSALYQMLARNLAAGQGYTLWGSPHVMVPPGYPALLAGLMWAGLGTTWCLNLATVLMTLAALAICYQMLREATSPQLSTQLAMLVTAIVALSQNMHLASLRLLSDVPALLLVWLGCWCYLRGLRSTKPWLEAGTLALLAACTMRVPAALAVAGAGIGLLLQARLMVRGATGVSPVRVRWNFAALAAPALIAGIVGAWYVQAALARQSLPSYKLLLNRVGERSASAWLLGPLENFVQTGEELSRVIIAQPMPPWLALFVLWLPIAIGGVLAWRRGMRLLVCVAAVYVGGTLLVRPMIPRYFLPVAPMLVLFYLEGARSLASLLPRWRPRAEQIMVGLAIVLIGCNLPRVARAVYTLHVPHAGRSHLETEPVEQVAAFVRNSTSPGERFVSNRDQRRLALLSNRDSVHLSEGKVFNRPPTADELREWARTGVAVYVERNLERPDYREGTAARFRDLGLPLIYESNAFRIYSMRPLLAQKAAASD